MTLLTAIILALMQVENAGGIEGGNGGGPLQLTEIFVRDVNRILGQEAFSLADRWNRVASIRMCRIWFAHYAKPEWTIRDYAQAFRIGPSTVGTQAEAQIADYCERVENMTNEILAFRPDQPREG